jgi:hypothetical protein
VFVQIQRLHHALPLPAPPERRGAHCQTKPNQIKKRREIISKKNPKIPFQKKKSKNSISKKNPKIPFQKKKNISNSKSARFFLFCSRG